MNHRRGFTLVETLVALSAASVVLTLSAVAIHRVMRVHTRCEAFHADEATAWRLSPAWRGDLMRAAEAQIEEDGTGWRVALTGIDRRVTHYRFSASGVNREEELSDGLGREAFRFSHPIAWRIERIDAPASGSPQILVTTVDPVGGQHRRGPGLGVNWLGRLGAAGIEGGGR